MESSPASSIYAFRDPSREQHAPVHLGPPANMATRLLLVCSFHKDSTLSGIGLLTPSDLEPDHMPPGYICAFTEMDRY